MAFFQSKQITNKEPLMSASSADDTVVLVGDFVTVTGMASGDIVEMVGLPAGYVPVDATLAVDASAGVAFTTDCGVLSGSYADAVNARTMGSEAFAASTAGQGAAGIQRLAKPGLLQLAPTETHRGIGIKIVGTLTTLVVGTNLRLNVLARTQREGV